MMVTTFSNFFFKTHVTEKLLISSKGYMSSEDDQRTIKKILNGDTTAFAILVNRYKNIVFSLALQMLRNKEEAEEVSQDSFIKIYKHLNNFNGDSKFSTWIYRITYNTCLDRIKAHKKYADTVGIDEFTENQVRTVETAFDMLARSDREKCVKECLRKLPEDDGVLIMLFYYDELSLSEIGKVIGINQNNIKIRLFRARKRLAIILKARLESTMLENYGQGNR